MERAGIPFMTMGPCPQPSWTRLYIYVHLYVHILSVKCVWALCMRLQGAKSKNSNRM